jgi:5-methylcytosine-specific restriction endonuclease McrA
MPTDRVTAELRRLVFARAKGRCEYCHTPEGFVPGSFEVEHIIPRSKGGQTILNNLALSCPACNDHKFNLILAELHPTEGHNL